MNIHEAIQSQYLAALAMLHQAIQKCPEAQWADPTDRNHFWHVTYHTLFYTHLYLHVRFEDFKAWEGHRSSAEDLKIESAKLGKPYSKAEALAFLDLIRLDLPAKIALTDLTAETSGFHWHVMSKLEFQIYTIRHLQQHTGELMERLGTREKISVDWISRKAIEN